MIGTGRGPELFSGSLIEAAAIWPFLFVTGAMDPTGSDVDMIRTGLGR